MSFFSVGWLQSVAADSFSEGKRCRSPGSKGTANDPEAQSEKIIPKHEMVQMVTLEPVCYWCSVFPATVFFMYTTQKNLHTQKGVKEVRNGDERTVDFTRNTHTPRAQQAERVSVVLFSNTKHLEL